MTARTTPAGTGDTNTESVRAAYLAFVREHHPDRGGNVDAFVAGLAEFRSAGRIGSGTPRGSQHWPADRYDAPVFVVVRPRGVRAVTQRLRRWWNRRIRKSRVC